MRLRILTRIRILFRIRNLTRREFSQYKQNLGRLFERSKGGEGSKDREASGCSSREWRAFSPTSLCSNDASLRSPGGHAQCLFSSRWPMVRVVSEHGSTASAIEAPPPTAEFMLWLGLPMSCMPRKA